MTFSGLAELCVLIREPGGIPTEHLGYRRSHLHFRDITFTLGTYTSLLQDIVLALF